MPNIFFRLNKKQYAVNEPAICGSCGNPMQISIKDIDYENPVGVGDEEQ